MPPPSGVQIPGQERTRRYLVWTILWVVFAAVHVTQAIWTSGGADYPGDMGDSRFCHLVLEHGYQALLGHQSWLSPAQFHPLKNTLGYSDTMVGTLPIYALGRAIGGSPERALQAWFVVVALLNGIAAVRFFAAWRIPAVLRGPLVFAATASASSVWMAASHEQLLPIFPLLWMGAELVRWSEDRQPRRLLAASGWFAWQFACTPYTAFFGAMVTASIAGSRWLVRLGAGPLPPPLPAPAPGRPGRWPLGCVCLAGWGLAAVSAYAFVQAERTGLRRSMTDVIACTPLPFQWFSASPVSVVYPTTWPSNRPGGVFECWFAGVGPWLAVLVAAGLGFASRGTRRGRWLLALSLGSVLPLLLITRWSPAHPGIWLRWVRVFPLLEAFRWSGRVAVPMQIAMIAAAGLILAGWSGSARPRWRFGPVFVACLLALEGLARGQLGTPIAVVQARTAAMIAAWRQAGDRPVLVFAPGYSNQRQYLFHLDAWSAAMQRRRTTVNGYSSGRPLLLEDFLATPTAANARALLAVLRLPADQVSLVEGFRPADEARLGIVHSPFAVVAFLRDFELQPVRWRLTAPRIARVVDDIAMYRFAPGSEAVFHLPDEAATIEYWAGFPAEVAAGAEPPATAGLTWLVQTPGAPPQAVAHEVLTAPGERRPVLRSIALPPGRDRELILRTDPASSPPSGELYLGRLRVSQP